MPLTLVGASLDVTSEPFVLLTFDREVDVGGMDPAGVAVNDFPGTGQAYVGFDVDGQPTPASVAVLLADAGPAPAAPTALLDATAATGIVAADDGGAWAGVEGLALPFP